MEKFEYYMNKFFRWLINAAIVLWVIVSLVGCDDVTPTTQNRSKGYDLTGPLEGCAAYKLNGDVHNLDLVVIRCPAADTTTTAYKKPKSNPVITILIDGQEYEATKKKENNGNVTQQSPSTAVPSN